MTLSELRVHLLGLDELYRQARDQNATRLFTPPTVTYDDVLAVKRLLQQEVGQDFTIEWEGGRNVLVPRL